MKLIRKAAILSMTVAIGLGLVWAYGPTVGVPSTLALAFIMFEYIARNDDES
jgi:hypothetical protein